VRPTWRAAQFGGTCDAQSIKGHGNVQSPDPRYAFANDIFGVYKIITSPDASKGKHGIPVPVENINPGRPPLQERVVSSQSMVSVTDDVLAPSADAVPQEQCPFSFSAPALAPKSVPPTSVPQQRVAELEGALEASRDRVKELESALDRGSRCEVKQVSASKSPECPCTGPVFKSSSGYLEAQCQMTSQTQEGDSELESLRGESDSASDSFTPAEELFKSIEASQEQDRTLLKRAVDITDACRTAHAGSGNGEALEDCEPQFARLLSEIQDREGKLLEVSRIHDKTEHDLEMMSLSLDAREQANVQFAKYLREWDLNLGDATVPAIHKSGKLPTWHMRSVLSGPPRLSKSVSGATPRSAVDIKPLARAGPPRRSPSGSMLQHSPSGSTIPCRGQQSPRLSLARQVCSPPRGIVVGSGRGDLVGSSTIYPDDSASTAGATADEPHKAVKSYAGMFSHPAFGQTELPIEVSLLSSSKGHWLALDQDEQITVKREGKGVVLADTSWRTVFEGQEIVGGALIGTVTQNGVPGGRFYLQPCKRKLARATLLKRTCIQRWTFDGSSRPAVPVQSERSLGALGKVR